MRSAILEQVRRAQAEREAGMSIDERLELMAQANAFAIELYASLHRLSREEARQRLARDDER